MESVRCDPMAGEAAVTIIPATPTRAARCAARADPLSMYCVATAGGRRAKGGVGLPAWGEADGRGTSVGGGTREQARLDMAFARLLHSRCSPHGVARGIQSYSTCFG